MPGFCSAGLMRDLDAEAGRLFRKLDSLHTLRFRKSQPKTLAYLESLCEHSHIGAWVPLSNTLAFGAYVNLRAVQDHEAFSWREDSVALSIAHLQIGRDISNTEIGMRTKPVFASGHLLERLTQRVDVRKPGEIRSALEPLMLVGNLLNVRHHKLTQAGITNVMAPSEFGLFAGYANGDKMLFRTMLTPPFNRHRAAMWRDLLTWYYLHEETLTELIVLRPILGYAAHEFPETVGKFEATADSYLTLMDKHKACLKGRDDRVAGKQNLDALWAKARAQRDADVSRTLA